MQESTTDISAIVQAAKKQFGLELHGIHGVAHWARVRENGLRLAKRTGADAQIVELFAYLHDCCRESDSMDMGHGRRAAEFAKTLRSRILHLSDAAFEILYVAIHDHETGRTRGDITAMTCWDADRLDLGRVSIRPEPRYLCTDAGKDADMIEWAYKRSRAR